MQFSSDWSQLFHAARGGDGEAYEKLLGMLREWLRKNAANEMGEHLRSKLDASDIVQNCLLDIQRQFDQFNGTTEAEFRSWAMQVLRNNAIDSARAFGNQRRDSSRERSLTSESDLPGDDPTASRIVAQRESDESLQRAIGQLSERRQQILALRHRDGMSFADIGSVMNLSEAAARQLWQRTIETLRNQLNQ